MRLSGPGLTRRRWDSGGNQTPDPSQFGGFSPGRGGACCVVGEQELVGGLSLPPSHGQQTQLDHRQRAPLRSHVTHRPPLAEGCRVVTASRRGVSAAACRSFTEQAGKSPSSAWMYILVLISELPPRAILALRSKTSASPPTFSNSLEKQRWDSVQGGARQSGEGKGIGEGDVPFPVPPGPCMPSLQRARSHERGHRTETFPEGHLSRRTPSQEGPWGEIWGCPSQLYPAALQGERDGLVIFFLAVPTVMVPSGAVVPRVLLPGAPCLRAGRKLPSRVSASFSAKTAIWTILMGFVQTALFQLTAFSRELANHFTSMQLKCILLVLV